MRRSARLLVLGWALCAACVDWEAVRQSGVEGLGAEDGGAEEAPDGGQPLPDGGQPRPDAGGAPDASVEPAECSAGERSCVEGRRRSCVGGRWQVQEKCAALCRAGDCVVPPSCQRLPATCGAGQATHCCATAPVPGGSFKRSYDGVNASYLDDKYVAKVSPFVLDTYEVTVGRFRAFFDSYAENTPKEGSGRNPSDGMDPGWSAAYPLPADAAALATAISGTGCTWTAAPSGYEHLPITCVDWYLAYAFCIYDGGRLPTEAEWNYAAAGGEEQRVYPWSNPHDSAAITASHAVYSVTAPAEVGMRSPTGDGRWGHADLAGNAAEWVRDTYSSPYATTSCSDCANLGSGDKVLRGGAFSFGATTLFSSARTYNVPASRVRYAGFRCARAP